MILEIIQNGIIKVFYVWCIREIEISWKHVIGFWNLLMLYYTDLFRTQQRYCGGDLYSVLIFPRTSGRKRPKRIERHIQSRDSEMRIMHWKIGPVSAQTDRKNVLPATKYEGRSIRYRWLRNNTAWTQWNSFHAAHAMSKTQLRLWSLSDHNEKCKWRASCEWI